MAEFSNLTHLLRSNGRAAKKGEENHKPPLVSAVFRSPKRKIPQQRCQNLGGRFLVARHAFL